MPSIGLIISGHGRKGGYSMVLKCFSMPDETTTLTFYPCNADTGPGGGYDTCADTLTVYRTDFMKLLLPYLQHVQPGFDAVSYTHLSLPTIRLV